ncbi:MAG: DUF1127 domain-containing protein [Geminicoccaceae bacterium]|nr:DUF1127 domain-containing protein [Geminicoccaceae bacterium]
MNPKRSFSGAGLDEPTRFPTPDEIDRYVQRSRQLRAEATAVMLSSIGRLLVRPIRRVNEPLTRRQRQRRTQDELAMCSDRVLEDIGIDRQAIPFVAHGLDPDAARPEPWWRSAIDRFRATARARQKSRRLEAQLAAYHDRELDDLGVRRADIPLVVRGRTPASAFG